MVLHTGELDGATVEKTLLAQGVGGLLLPSVWLAVDSLPKLGTGKADVAGAKRLAQTLLSDVGQDQEVNRSPGTSEP